MSPVRTLVLTAAAAALALPAHAKEAPENPLIDYPGFVELAGKVGEYREVRRLPWEEFAARARADGSQFAFTAKCRIDTANEMEYYRNGGILQYVLRKLAA